MTLIRGMRELIYSNIKFTLIYFFNKTTLKTLVTIDEAAANKCMDRLSGSLFLYLNQVVDDRLRCARSRVLSVTQSKLY